MRYFSPESEVPLCGHATIAPGAAPMRIVQGEDMGRRSVIVAEPGTESGASVRMSGAVPIRDEFEQTSTATTIVQGTRRTRVRRRFRHVIAGPGNTTE